MQSVPVQSWTFEQESVIRIGRSTDNHVILYSAVVSRHHVEIRKHDAGWEIVNLGANGTYLEGRRITQVPVEDGVIIRLARSGPNIQIHLGVQTANVARALVGEKTIGQRPLSGRGTLLGEPSPPSEPEQDMLADIPPTHSPEVGESLPELVFPVSVKETSVEAEEPWHPLDPNTAAVHPTDGKEVDPAEGKEQSWLSPCCYRYLKSDRLFCLDCGKPLHVIGHIGDYQILKVLEEGELNLTQLAWREGRTVVLISLNPGWSENPDAIARFEQESNHLLQINHPALPRFTELLHVAGQSYLVMEPIYGQTWQQVVANQGPIAPEQAIAQILKVCQVLDYLHQQSPPILHLALSPDTLIRRPHSATSDLGVLGLVPGRREEMVRRFIPAAYAAPEQQQGQASPAADLYALGLTLVYLVTGQPPRSFYAQREQGFRFYPEYIPGLPADLITILRKLTNPQPDERFATAQELADVLQQLGPVKV